MKRSVLKSGLAAAIATVMMSVQQQHTHKQQETRSTFIVKTTQTQQCTH